MSPHEFLQAIMKASKKRFRIGQQSDPVEFMAWLLNTLHADLRTSKKNNSIIYECFQVVVFFLSIFKNFLSYKIKLVHYIISWVNHLSQLWLSDTWQGELEVVKEIPSKAIADKKENNDDQNGIQKSADGGNERDGVVTETSRMSFLMLGLDLPPPPLFKDVMEKNIIPQVLVVHHLS